MNKSYDSESDSGFMSAPVQAESVSGRSQTHMQLARHALQEMQIFQGLDTALLDRLAKICSIVHASADEIVSRQGDPADALHVLIHGQLSTFNTAPNGTIAVVEVVRAGEALGLPSVLAGLPRQLTAQAITECELLALDTKALLALIADEPALVTAMLRAQATEFRALVRQVCDLKLRTTAQRLGCYLLSLSAPIEGNSVALRLPFDKRLLAARLGCRQENLSRAFAALRSFGVETHGARVILHDIAKLHAYSEPDEPLGQIVS